MEEVPPRWSPRSWSDIPVELAGMILGRLAAHVDRVRFAAVCPQWRAAAQQGGLPPPMPLLLLPDATVYSLPGSGPFHFPSCVGYKGACGDWLAFSGEDGCCLRDPLSNATVTLPPLTRFRVQHVGDGSVDEAARAWMEMYGGKGLVASNIMFCSPHLVAAIVRFSRDGDTRIAVCQPGVTSFWSVHVDHCWTPSFADMVFHQGTFYSLDWEDTLFAVDISIDPSTGDPSVSKIQEVISGIIACQYMPPPGGIIVEVPYLVESHGALLLVCHFLSLKPEQRDGIEDIAPEQNRFEVYEANFEQSRWATVTTLGDDQALFLCLTSCRSVSISHNYMPGDRIFFVQHQRRQANGVSKEASSSCRVYDMRDGKVSTALPMVSSKPDKGVKYLICIGMELSSKPED